MKRLLFCSYYTFLFISILAIDGFAQSAWQPAFPMFNKTINQLQPVSDSEAVVRADYSTFCARLNSVSGAVDTFLLPQSNFAFSTMHWRNREVGILALTQHNGTGRGKYFVRFTTDAGRTWQDWHFPEHPNLPQTLSHKALNILNDGSFIEAIGGSLLLHIVPSTGYYSKIQAPGDINGISFADRDNGWVWGSDTLWFTSNGGVSWGGVRIGGLHFFVKDHYSYIIQNDSLKIVSVRGDIIDQFPVPKKIFRVRASSPSILWIIAEDSTTGGHMTMMYKPSRGWVQSVTAPNASDVSPYSESTIWLQMTLAYRLPIRQDWFYTRNRGFLNDTLLVNNYSTLGKARARVYVSSAPDREFERILMERKSDSETKWNTIGILDFPMETYWDENLSFDSTYRYRATVEYRNEPPAIISSEPFKTDSTLHIDLLEYMLPPRYRTIFYTYSLTFIPRYGQTSTTTSFVRYRRSESIVGKGQIVHLIEREAYDDQNVFIGRKLSSLNESLGYTRALFVGSDSSMFPPLQSGRASNHTTISVYMKTEPCYYPLPRFVRLQNADSMNPPGSIKLSSHSLVSAEYTYTHNGGLKLSSWIEDYGFYTINRHLTLDSITVSTKSVASPIFTLHQNFPNPFNPGTTIRFTLPKYDHATLRVYDVLGQLVATLADGWLEAGNHEVQFHAGDIPSGVYLYVLQAGGQRVAKTMVVMK